MIRTLVLVLVLGCAALFPLAGCGDSSNKPPAAAMAPRNDPPPKIPTTVDEKIAAIQKSPLPEERKKAEIEKVKAGTL